MRRNKNSQMMITNVTDFIRRNIKNYDNVKLWIKAALSSFSGPRVNIISGLKTTLQKRGRKGGRGRELKKAAELIQIGGGKIFIKYIPGGRHIKQSVYLYMLYK
jgi:hypothetical protein